MICPLCEHVQDAGDSCDVCGQRWSSPAPIAVADETVDGLELTRMQTIEPVSVVPLARLERGREPTAAAPRAEESISLTADDDVGSRCANCGLLNKLRERCGACGVPLRPLP